MTPHRVAALIACHNRKPKTLACLRALFASADAAHGVELHTFVTDDGSTDGTSDAIRSEGWPVDVTSGDGSLFWTGGTVQAWKRALASGLEFDAFLLLNDDTVLDVGALSSLADLMVQERDAIVVGATRDPTSGGLTYGGVVRAAAWHPGKMRRLPIGAEPQEADTFNANCVLVPKQVHEVVGMLDATFVHGMSDFDYGLRARRAGFRIVVAPGTLGTCSRNVVTGTWEDASLPLRRRLALLDSPKGLPRREWGAYLRRHGPWFWRLLAVMPTARVFVTWLARAVTPRRPLR